MKPQTHKNTDKTDKADKADKVTAIHNEPAASPKAAVKTAMPTTTAPKTKGKWGDQIKAAKHEWSKLSEAELLKSDGNSQQLTGLVQQRYAIDRHVAEKQVKAFLVKCNIA